jgi:hypothetical protein
VRDHLDELWDLSERFVELIRASRSRWKYYPDNPGMRSLSFEELDRLAAAKEELRQFVDEHGPRLAALSVILATVVREAPLVDDGWEGEDWYDAGWNAACRWITDLLDEEWRKHCATEEKTASNG